MLTKKTICLKKIAQGLSLSRVVTTIIDAAIFRTNTTNLAGIKILSIYILI